MTGRKHPDAKHDMRAEYNNMRSDDEDEGSVFEAGMFDSATQEIHNEQNATNTEVLLHIFIPLLISG